MRVERKKIDAFAPIVITITKREEAKMLFDLIERDINHKISFSLCPICTLKKELAIALA